LGVAESFQKRRRHKSVDELDDVTNLSLIGEFISILIQQQKVLVVDLLLHILY
jgi:hypothetical protein